MIPDLQHQQRLIELTTRPSSLRTAELVKMLDEGKREPKKFLDRITYDSDDDGGGDDDVDDGEPMIFQMND